LGMVASRRKFLASLHPRYSWSMSTPGWFLQRYSNEDAVLRAGDFELLEDFRYAVMTMQPSSFGGSVVNWMSRELIVRDLAA
jgi:hypothetical protein